ncbi:type I-F CRISPR-associated endoribonuclease Cas6/Csy4 [Photobacterium sp. ZSDE20]|uniref:Type I-F CRISPR-associated endoribonuclease Cas6/Csy4 n=1 Tax=Photobacterium pectinilyticum TaxID=2906793 RepID=A0ABT1N6X1_9GAMM|nr:type I-F CRISPR-associated endoribonuclease Cas6/Csy4 [Photobacterium sp. ZSDE20]MCQ1060466.1 type I-F CRISPR-associated endoribonuclease Cas6/Csy4 [Photobacterium sp. ZSDE20]MDD1826216.1 type I-F CRISPR-associated endoribonuclease Cas6/Csy4 [Photobacterium sp. ZSDE20]
MDIAYYIDITHEKKCKYTNYQLAERLLREVHHLNASKAHTENVAISLPEFALNGVLGNRFQLFGSLNALEQLINNRDFAQIQGLHGCSVSSVRQVPPSTEHGFYVFVRNRHHERQTKGYVARSEDRAIRRAMMGVNVRLKNADDVLNRRDKMLASRLESEAKPLRVAMNSASSPGEGHFYIYINAVQCSDKVVCNPNNYGLSSRKKPLALPIIL